LGEVKKASCSVERIDSTNYNTVSTICSSVKLNKLTSVSTSTWNEKIARSEGSICATISGNSGGKVFSILVGDKLSTWGVVNANASSWSFITRSLSRKVCYTVDDFRLEVPDCSLGCNVETIIVGLESSVTINVV